MSKEHSQELRVVTLQIESIYDEFSGRCVLDLGCGTV
jgi:predicted RNA methylase